MLANVFLMQEHVGALIRAAYYAKYGSFSTTQKNQGKKEACVYITIHNIFNLMTTGTFHERLIFKMHFITKTPTHNHKMT